MRLQILLCNPNSWLCVCLRIADQHSGFDSDGSDARTLVFTSNVRSSRQYQIARALHLILFDATSNKLRSFEALNSYTHPHITYHMFGIKLPYTASAASISRVPCLPKHGHSTTSQSAKPAQRMKGHQYKVWAILQGVQSYVAAAPGLSMELRGRAWMADLGPLTPPPVRLDETSPRSLTG